MNYQIETSLGRLNPASAIYLLLSLTRRCNMRCLNCFFAMQAPDFFAPYDIVFEKAIEIIDFYSGLGIRQVVPNAEGEALLHPRYQDIVKFIIERVGVRPWLVTNGILLNMHAEFVARNLCEVLVSVDGPHAEAYAAYRGGSSALFRQVIENIKELVFIKKGLPSPPAVMINCVVTADRCNEIPAMLQLAEEIGVDGIRFTNFHPTGEKNAVRSLYVDDRQVVEVLRRIIRRQDYKVSIYLPNLLGLARPPFYCRMLSSVVVGVNGDFAPCCRIAPAEQWGNFFVDTDRHNNATLREFRQRFSEAKTLEDLPVICLTCGYLCQLRPVFIQQRQQWVDSRDF